MAITYSSGVITISGAYSSGTATAGGAATLTDSTKSWTASSPGTTLGLGFRQVWITGGTGAGQVRGIKTNTATVLTLWDAWDTVPDATSTYAIGYAPRDVLASAGAYVSAYAGLTAPDSIKIDTDTDIVVASGGYYGSCGSPAHIFEYSFRGLDSVPGSFMAFGRLMQQSGYGSGGGVFSYGVNVADPSSGGKYADGLYHSISIEGRALFYGCAFVGAYDFYFDAALGINGNRRSRIVATTSSGDGKDFVDCVSDGIPINTGAGDTIRRTTAPGATLSRLATTIDGLVASVNYGLNPTDSGNGHTFSDLKFIGSPDYATRVTGRPFFLYQWRTADGNVSNYIMNLEVPIAALQGTNIVKAFQFDLNSTANSPNGVIWMGFSNAIVVKDNALAPIAGAVVGCKDADGNAGWLSGKGAAYPYTPTFTAAQTTDANGRVAEASVIKGKIKWNGSTTLATSYGAWDTGYPNNPWTLTFRRYGYLEGTQVLDPDNSAGRQTLSQTLLANPFVVASEATAAGYTGITINGAAKTIVVSGTRTIQELYDYAQWWAAQAANIAYDTPMTTSDGVGFALAAGWAMSVTGSLASADKSMATKPTVSSGGFFEDADGAIWEAGGSTYYAAHAYLRVVDAVSAADIEGAVVGFGDADTQERLLYNTSLALDTLVTDAGGEAEGYFVYRVDATTYADLKQVVGEYSYQFSLVPRALSGVSIGSAVSPEVIRLQPDTQVVSTKSEAALISGPSVDVATTTIDLSDETLDDAYDSLKYQATADADIDTGIPGCMFYCLYGLPLTKANNAFTGISGWKYFNLDGGTGSFTGGVFAVDTGEEFSSTITSTVMEFTDAGTYDYRANSFNGTIEITNTSGGAVTLKMPVGVTVVNTGPNITLEQSTVVTVELPNLIDGTMVWVADTTAGTGPGQPVEMHYEVVTGGAGYSHSFEFTGNFPFRIEATYVNGATAKLPLVINATMTSGGYYSAVTQEDAVVYNRICSELSTTGQAQDSSNGGPFTADLVNIQLDVSDPDNVLDARLGIIWYYWKCTQLAGIRIYSPDALVYTPDEYNIVVNGPIQIENVKAATLKIINGNWVRSDGAELIASTSNTIHWQGYLQAFTGDITIQGDVLIDETTVHGALDSYPNKDDYKADVSSVTASINAGDIHTALDSYSNKDDYKADVSNLDVAVSTRLAASSYEGKNTASDVHTALDSYDNKDDWKFSTSNLHTGLDTYAGKDSYKASVTGLSTLDTTDIHAALDSYANKSDWKADVANLDVAVSTRLAAADYEGRLTSADIHNALNSYSGKDDWKADVSNLDVAVSTRLAASSYEGKNTVSDIHTALDAYANKNDWMADVSNLDVPVSTRLAAATYVQVTAADIWNYDVDLVVDDDTAAQVLKDAKQNALNAFAVSV